MKILIDTREQDLLEFGSKVHTERRKLDVGDYGCEMDDGTIVPVIFERKSVGDWMSTLTNNKKAKTQNYDRFKKEIQRAKDSNIKLLLIIEATFTGRG